MVTSPNNPLDIVNMALGYIGEAPVRSIDNPSSDVERMAKLYYHQSRQYCLTLSTWNFAKKQTIVNLTADIETDFESSYQLPTDLITFLSVEGDDEYEYNDHYDIRGDRLLYSNSLTVMSTDPVPVPIPSPVRIRYVCDEERVTRWSPGFRELVARKLAIELAYALSKKDSIIKTQDALMRTCQADAIAKDGGERPPLRVEGSQMLARRRHLIGGWGDDPTRIRFE